MEIRITEHELDIECPRVEKSTVGELAKNREHEVQLDKVIIIKKFILRNECTMKY